MNISREPAPDALLQSRLKLRHLQALVTIAEGHSLQHGASALARTPSAISKSLAELESLLGQRLFTRTRRGLVPTEVGEQLIRDARRGLGVLFDAVSRASTGEPDHTAGIVRLGTLPTSATVSSAAIAAFREHHPSYEVRVVERRNFEMLDMLRSRTLDFIIGRLGQPEQMAGMSFEPLYEEQTICVVANGHPLLEAIDLNFDEICRYPAILPESGTVLRTTLDPLIRAHLGKTHGRMVEMMSTTCARPLMENSDFVWFTAPGVVALDVRRGWLQRLPLEFPSTRRHVGITTLKDEPLTAAAREMLALMRSCAKSMR